MEAVIKRWGNSVGLVIPRALARELSLTAGTTVDIAAHEDAMVVRKRRSRAKRPLAKLVAQIDAKAYRKLPGWDDAAGGETW